MACSGVFWPRQRKAAGRGWWQASPQVSDCFRRDTQNPCRLKQPYCGHNGGNVVGYLYEHSSGEYAGKSVWRRHLRGSCSDFCRRSCQRGYVALCGYILRVFTTRLWQYNPWCGCAGTACDILYRPCRTCRRGWCDAPRSAWPYLHACHSGHNSGCATQCRHFAQPALYFSAARPSGTMGNTLSARTRLLCRPWRTHAESRDWQRWAVKSRKRCYSA